MSGMSSPSCHTTGVCDSGRTPWSCQEPDGVSRKSFGRTWRTSPSTTVYPPCPSITNRRAEKVCSWADSASPGNITCRPEKSHPQVARSRLRSGLTSMTTRRAASSALTSSVAFMTLGRRSP